MRTEYRINHRFIALFLAVLMLLSSVQFAGFTFHVMAEDAAPADVEYTIRDDALHFIIRHWHTDYDPDATRQDMTDQQDGDDWFVVVEGYIVKLREGDPGYHEKFTDPVTGNTETRNFRILLVNQKDGSLTPVSTDPTPYVLNFDRELGTLTLAIKPRRERNPLFGPDHPGEPEYIEYEKYCGTSLSAGRGAIEELKDAKENTIGITISYDNGNTHIVKGHVFYNSWNKTVPGSADPAVFNENNPEIDTAEVYTWKADYKTGSTTYKPGDIITYTDGDQTVACYTQEDLEKAARELNGSNQVEQFISRYFSDKPTKFYSTLEGLHTNKTLVEVKEGDTGRLFLADLEAWYVEGAAADIAFVLDASGSMAFTADTPGIVNVYNAIANRVGIQALTNKDGEYGTDDDDVVYAYRYTSKNTKTIYQWGKEQGDEKAEAEKSGFKYEYHSADVSNDAKENYAELKDFIDYLANTENLRGEFVDTIKDKLDNGFEEKDWDTLWGMSQKLENPDYLYPQHDKLIGYYEIQNNSCDVTGPVANYRTWFYNSINAANKNVKYRNPAAYDGNEARYTSAKTNDFASVVLYHEEGNAFHFNDNVPIIKCQDQGAQSWGDFPINFNNGISSNRSYGANLRQANAGVLLNATPTTEKFTVSFTLENRFDTANAIGDDDKTVNSFNQPIEILYVGAMSGDKSAGGYLRVTREAGDLKIYNGHNAAALATLSGVFGSSATSINRNRQRFTFVFNGDNVEIYLGDVKRATVEINGLSGGNTIVFSPFEDWRSKGNSATGDALFYLDDIFVYDTALLAGEVSQFVTAYNAGFTDGKASNIDDRKSITATVNWNDVFILNPTVLEVMLNPHNTAHVELGVAAYNYFVYDANSSGTPTLEYTPLAYWDGSQDGNAAKAGERVIGKLEQNQEKTPGWYYLSHGSTVADIKTLGTAKRLIGLNGDNNSASIGSKSGYVYDKADLPEYDQGFSPDGTGAEYKVDTNAPIRFYLDGNGNLRCFFSRGSKITACSYVYELSDNQYVKTESLQRALASFSAELSERSPASKLSAVRFSMPEGNLTTGGWDLSNLVLLDWTNDSAEFATIMSQKRLAGKATDFEKSKTNGINQYNYVLTGGTVTYTGLYAYKEHLEPNASTDTRVSKYLVIVTDGVDSSSEDEKKKSRDYADELKQKGYTIITIYLPGATALDEDGNIKPYDTNYQNAKEFLKSLAGTKDTKAENAEAEGYFFASNDPQKLQELFDNKIMARLVDSMEDYTVRDYIDPRFDLMEEVVEEVVEESADKTTFTETDVVWHLYADGKVVKTTKEGVQIGESINVSEKDPETNDWYTIHLTRECTPTARDPYLRYDENKDMYYLEWVDQTIPATPEDSTDLLPVWTAEFLLRAKDDFIGGNAILTNGNEKEMNWLFHPYDSKLQEERDNYIAKLRKEFEYAFEHTLTALQRNDYVLAKQSALGLSAQRWDQLSAEEKANVLDAYVEEKVAETIKTAGNNASSDTEDMLRVYDTDATTGEKTYDDYYPSKGFPRTVANVRPLAIETEDVTEVIYMGEGISPQQMIEALGDDAITDIYYLDYLKRYAHLKYMSQEQPLLALLADWLEYGVEGTSEERAISIPYMYLPSYPYNKTTGRFITDEPQTNSTGKAIHEQDLIGILTYRWSRADENGAEGNPTETYVKDNTELVIYKLTVEYTPLRIEDDWNALDNLGFASFKKFGTTDLFDRKEYIDGHKAVVTDSAYKWDESYKPVVGKVQPDPQVDGGEVDYGDADLTNGDRTLKAHVSYTKQPVSGGIALELRMLVGELEELKEALEAAAAKTRAAGDVTFTVNGTRQFTDTAIEAFKEKQGDEWKDYGDTFVFTFDLAYQDWDLLELEAQKDANGYVSVFVGTSRIETEFGDEDRSGNQLPIGTYTFKADEVKKALEDVIGEYVHFDSAGVGSKFYTDYFDDKVLNGLGEKGDNGEIDPEITSSNIGDYCAEADASNGKIVFYVGTDSSNARGDVDTGNDYYINDRLGMLKLSTGMTLLTVREEGAQPNENFLYRITGKTLGGAEVDLIVAVPGYGSTTVELFPGDYTVTEISDWSWKYYNKETYGEPGEDWKIIPNWKEASASLRHTNDDPIEEHKTVTFVHARNDKSWLGGEGHADNKFR